MMSASENSQKTLLDKCLLCFESLDFDMAKWHFRLLNEQKLPVSCVNRTHCSATVCCKCYTCLQEAQASHVQLHHAIRCIFCSDDRGFPEMNPTINRELCDMLVQKHCEMLDDKKRARRQPQELPLCQRTMLKQPPSNSIHCEASSGAPLSKTKDHASRDAH